MPRCDRDSSQSKVCQFFSLRAEMRMSMGGESFRRKLQEIHDEHKRLQSQVGPTKSQIDDMAEQAGKTATQRPIGKVVTKK